MLQNPVYRGNKRVGDVIRPRAVGFRIAPLEEYGTAPRAPPGFHVAPAIADHHARAQVEIVLLGGAKDQAGLRLAA